MNDLMCAVEELSECLKEVKTSARETSDELEQVSETLEVSVRFLEEFHSKLVDLLEVYNKKAFTSLLSEEVEELISKISEWKSQINDFLDEI